MIKTTEINNRTNIIAFKKVCTWPLMLAISSILASPVYAAPPSAVGPQNGLAMKSFFSATGVMSDNTNFNSENDGRSYFCQEFLTMGSYTVGSDYSVNWKGKIATGIFGQDFAQTSNGGADSNEWNEISIQEFYARANNLTFDFSVGLAPYMTGNGWNLQSGGTGAVLKIFPTDKIHVSMIAMMEDENDSDDDTGYFLQNSYSYVDGNDGDDDEYLFGLELGTEINAGEVKVYYGARIAAASSYTDSDGITTETGKSDLHTVGLSGRYKLDNIDFEGEASTFFGSASDESDYVGNQITVGATYHMPSASINGNIYYAMAGDEDETQAAYIDKLGMQQPFQKGLGPSFDHDDDDFKSMAKPTSIFMLSQNSGVLGAGINGLYNPIKSVTLSGGVIYVTPRNSDTDSSAGPFLDSSWKAMTVLNAGVDYRYNQYFNTGLAVSYVTLDADEGSTLDDNLVAGVRVKFTF
jgi:hypothetical protein